ncbi:MAG: hypothetical protein LBU69_04540 [Deltaproteobacteria bacterium]|nr:hypothetical protein [Deltaproteobacteria bacterium]
MTLALPGVTLSQDENKANSEPSYTLETNPDDTHELARLKAAYRLMSAYTQVQKICELCSQPRVMQGFHSANGTVLAKITKVFKETGALNDKWKAAVTDYTDKAVEKAMSENNCNQLIALIKEDHWSLYKGRFLDDYNIVINK